MCQELINNHLYFDKNDIYEIINLGFSSNCMLIKGGEVQRSNSGCGTIGYIAPEILAGEGKQNNLYFFAFVDIIYPFKRVMILNQIIKQEIIIQ